MKGLAPIAAVALLALAPHAAAAGTMTTALACYTQVWYAPIQCARAVLTADELSCTKTHCTTAWTLRLQLEGSAYSCGRAWTDAGHSTQACGMPSASDTDGPRSATYERGETDATYTVSGEICSYVLEQDQNCAPFSLSIVVPAKPPEDAGTPGGCPLAARGDDGDVCGGIRAPSLPGIPEGVGLATLLAALP